MPVAVADHTHRVSIGHVLYAHTDAPTNPHVGYSCEIRLVSPRSRFRFCGSRHTRGHAPRARPGGGRCVAPMPMPSAPVSHRISDLSAQLTIVDNPTYLLTYLFNANRHDAHHLKCSTLVDRTSTIYSVARKQTSKILNNNKIPVSQLHPYSIPTSPGWEGARTKNYWSYSIPTTYRPQGGSYKNCITVHRTCVAAIGPICIAIRSAPCWRRNLCWSHNERLSRIRRESGSRRL